MSLKLEDLDVYNLAMKMGDDIWNLSVNFEPFVKNTLGYQITRSADSIALNIAEGFGRYHFKENKNFCFYSRGSLIETKSCLEKLKSRELITTQEFDKLTKDLEHLHIKLNAYIKSIGRIQ